MAYVSDPSQQQNNLQGYMGSNPLSQQAPLSTSAAPGAGPAAPGTTSGPANNQGPSQPFVNLQDYMTANAPQIQGMGQQVARAMGDQYNKTVSDIGTGQANFESAVNSGYATPNPQGVSQAISNAQSGNVTPTDISTFQGQANDKYTGPANFEGSSYYQNLNNEVQSAAQAGNLIQTPAGLQNYLQTSLETNPTAGDTTLDAALLQSSPEAMGAIQKAGQPLGTLPNYLSNAVTAENQAIQQAQQGAQQAQQQAQAAINPMVSSFQNAQNASLATANSKAQAYNSEISDIQSRLSAGQPLTVQEQSDIGSGALSVLNPYGESTGIFQNAESMPLVNSSGQISNYVNPNFLQSYFTPGSVISPPTLANVETPQQVAEAQALNQLLGQNTLETPTPGTPFSVPKSAGTFNDMGAVKGLYDALQAGGVPMYMSSGMTQSQLSANQQAWLNDVQALQAYMNGTPIPAAPTTQNGPPALSSGGGRKGI